MVKQTRVKHFVSFIQNLKNIIPFTFTKCILIPYLKAALKNFEEKNNFKESTPHLT